MNIETIEALIRKLPTPLDRTTEAMIRFSHDELVSLYAILAEAAARRQEGK